MYKITNTHYWWVYEPSQDIGHKIMPQVAKPNSHCYLFVYQRQPNGWIFQDGLTNVFIRT